MRRIAQYTYVRDMDTTMKGHQVATTEQRTGPDWDRLREIDEILRDQEGLHAGYRLGLSKERRNLCMKLGHVKPRR